MKYDTVWRQWMCSVLIIIRVRVYNTFEFEVSKERRQKKK